MPRPRRRCAHSSRHDMCCSGLSVAVGVLVEMSRWKSCVCRAVGMEVLGSGVNEVVILTKTLAMYLNVSPSHLPSVCLCVGVPVCSCRFRFLWDCVSCVRVHRSSISPRQTGPPPHLRLLLPSRIPNRPETPKHRRLKLQRLRHRCTRSRQSNAHTCRCSCPCACTHTHTHKSE